MEHENSLGLDPVAGQIQESQNSGSNGNERKSDIGTGESVTSSTPVSCDDACTESVASRKDEHDNAELIQQASEQVLKAAIAMERSDSILSHSEEGSCNSDWSPPIPAFLEHAVSNSSVRYMEEASFEASLVSPNHHRLAPSGRLGRRRTSSSRDVIDLRIGISDPNIKEEIEDENEEDRNLNNSERRQSERDVFIGLSSDSQQSHANNKLPPLDTIYSINSGEEKDTSHADGDELSGILGSCGLNIPAHKHSAHDEAGVLLHCLFEDFCTSAIDLEVVEQVLERESKQDGRCIDLPVDIIVHKPSRVITNLIGSPLLRVPKSFALAFFRILVRLLTNESDEDYDRETLGTCPWYDEAFKTGPTGLEGYLTRQRTYSTASLKKQSSFSEKSFNRGSAARKADQMYTMVRLRRDWNDAVLRVYNLLDNLVQERQHDYLLAPVARLLGLLCTGGVKVNELRNIISLTTQARSVPRAQLLLVRALKVAAEGASRSSLLVGKASPRHFFSFGYGPGMNRRISLRQTSWPFRNDFGMALWFRAERFCNSSVLLRVSNEIGSGLEVSLLPLHKNSKDHASATVLAVSILESGKVVHCIKVNSCVLLPRVWYHVGVRHTRSRLKGVFSLSSREQLAIMLDGKVMVNEPLKFPHIVESPGSSLSLTFGEHFDGQTGALYVFHENASDATFRALYEMTAGTSGVIQRRASAHDGWDSRRGDIARKSRMLDLSMRRDDMDDIVLSHRGSGKESVSSTVADLDDEIESFENSPLSKASFNSRLYVVWDPMRTEGDVALELHAGAHVKMESDTVQPWSVEGAQDVISSIGGVQALLPVFRSLLSGEVEKWWSRSENQLREQCFFDNTILCSIVPDLFSMLASFVRDHNENAREMLRCGGIDIVEQLLVSNNNVGADNTGVGLAHYPVGSLTRSLSIFPGLANKLVDSLLELRSACTHYVGLETRVFSRLLFNLPLWLGGNPLGISLYRALLPVLSAVTRSNPEKVRDCIGTKDVTLLIGELIEAKDDVVIDEACELFSRNTGFPGHLLSLTIAEKRHVVDVLLAMLLQVLGSGLTSYDNFSHLLHLISNYLEAEWEEASREVSTGSGESNRVGKRLERHMFTVRACTVLLFLLEIQPTIPNLYESLAHSCGSVHGAAGWILSAMVNSYSDDIRSIGVRCIVAYLQRTAKSPESPLSLDGHVAIGQDKTKPSENIGTSSNTFALISNVGTGLLMSNVTQKLAAMGPSVRSPSKLTAAVVYKLLWHLLKSHRYRLGTKTQSSLIHMVFEDGNSSSQSFNFLRDNFVEVDDILGEGVKLDIAWADTVLTDTQVGPDSRIRDSLGVGTIMRLLRFLPGDYTDHWLSIFVGLSATNQGEIGKLCNYPDWQPCLFQLISEVLEQMTSFISLLRTSESTAHKGNASEHASSADPAHTDGMPSVQNSSPEETRSVVANTWQHNSAKLSERFDLSVELYAVLLGHCIREGGEKALDSVEIAASLQRVCLNGPEVFGLILSRVLANLAEYGVIPVDGYSSPSTQPEMGGPNSHLKRSARLVTNAILSNGADGLDMPGAVSRWRCLRHLTAVTVAVVTKSSLGVADLFDYRNQRASAIDQLSGGLHGIRFPDGSVVAIRARDLALYFEILNEGSSSPLPAESATRDAKSEHGILRRVCVTLAAQLLSLLDVFIFPDSLDASLPTSQLHGLALVRSTETRIGTSQGPLLGSAIRLSLVLLCHLEPCSVNFLQSSSRLRCFVHWVLELIRETEALDGYSAAFNDLTAPFDRLILAIVLLCHRALGRCGALLTEIESSTFDTYFESKESQKKYYRRLLRVALELRDIILTAYKGRNDVLRASLLPMAFASLQKCLETSSQLSDEQNLGKVSHKELTARATLNSDWVTKFQDVDIRGDQAFPEQVERGDDEQRRIKGASRGVLAVESLSQESNDIISNFEKALDTCFEEYLEAQRRWAETGAVRDMEYEGDTTLKRLSGRHKIDIGGYTKLMLTKASAAENRWKDIDRRIVEVWRSSDKWKLARYPDNLGRRILLVRNRNFDDHKQASYELLMGMEREKEERDREERLRKKQELSELMKRNSEAFVPYDVTDIADGEDDERDNDEGDIESSHQVGDPALSSAVTDHGSFDDEKVEDEDTDNRVGADVDADVDADAWAKAFIWSDGESVVARFDSVMVVSLQSLVTGKVLLTTHGLYFHQIGEEMNVMTKETVESAQSIDSDINDRRWRLSRLTEVLGRRYMLRGQALELFFSDSHEVFLNFLAGAKERDRFFAKLRNSCKVPLLWSPKSLNPRVVFKKSKYTELWRKRKISNFDYLMALNKMAGRTFNDIAQWPVFPWVLCDYTSSTIDLSDSRVYRDLTKPVGALNPNRLAQLLERYNELEQFGFSESEKFLYGSHYSSPGVVLHFLLRQEPFTSMAIDLQSGRFDCPDRLFFDLSESWSSCNTSSSDVKELIPELFTLPEAFLNTNDFPLGSTQRGRQVNDVGLPPWAKGSAHEFVRIHRLALESEYVSRNLHHWIDLIFGYQQRGTEAEAAHNVFHHLSYEGSVDLDKIADELDRKAAESHIQNFGQTPSQLLIKEPHPSRYPVEDCWKPLIHDMLSPKRLRCHTPSRQYGGKKGGPGAVAKIHIQTDSVLVVYADLTIGIYKWAPKSGTGGLKPDKVRLLPSRELSNSRAAMKRGSAAPQTMNHGVSRLAVGNWSFAFTVGGYEKEQLRRKAVMPSRLASAKDALYTDASALLVSCGFWDSTVKVHAVDTWRQECSETGGHRGPIRCLAIGENGGILVTGGQDSTCRVWLVDHPDMAIALSDGYVQTNLGQSNDGDQVLSCCHVLWGHQSPITCLAISTDLDVVVSGSMEGIVCVHTVRRGEFVRRIQPPSFGDFPVSRLALDATGRIVVHMEDGELHVFSVNGVHLGSVDAGEKIHDMVISGEVIITGGDRCHLYIRSIVDLQVISFLDLSRHGPIRCIALTPAELNPSPQFLFIGSDDGAITIVDRDNGKV